jgi:hypothetical protein
MNPIERGEGAKRLLGDEVMMHAVSEYSQALIMEWEGSQTPSRREELWHQMTALKAVMNNLVGYVNNGEYELQTNMKEH